MIAVLYCIGAYVAVALSLFGLARMSVWPQRTSFYARTLAAYGTLVLCAIFGVVAALSLRLVGRHRLTQWATGRSYKWSMRWTTDVRFEIIQGEEYLDAVRPAVLIGNHQSALDILFLGTIWPRYCSVTAKSSLRFVPFLGWFMSLSGTVFIDRGNRHRAIQAFDRAAEEMRQSRQSVFIFPEGTRSNAEGPELGEFKKGAFHLAVRAQVPILPIVCANYHGVLSLKQSRFRAGRIPVVVMKPVETTGLMASDVDALMDRCHRDMATQLRQLTQSSRGQHATLP